MMCKAFSCVVTEVGKVLWKLGMDSHEDIIKKYKIKDTEKDPQYLKFARVEIVPRNGDYLSPDTWVLEIDESITPVWWNEECAIAAHTAKDEWYDQLSKILVKKPIIHPFKIKDAVVGKQEIRWLKEWASVGASVRDSVGASVGDSVGASVGASVWASVRASVRDSVRDSVRASVRASVWASVWDYTGSFFLLPRNAWKYTDKISRKGYPFQSLVNLWERGLVPSFDGTTWRLHAGKKAKIVYEWRKDHAK